jgi:outer membrane cobalamin receptor
VEHRTVLGLEVRRALAAGTELQIAASANELRSTNSNLPDSPVDTTSFYSRNTARVFRRTVDARLVTAVTSHSTLTAGLSYQTQSEVNDGWSQFQTFPSSTTNFTQQRYNTGLYANWFAQPTSALIVNGGARIDHNNVFGDFVTVREGASYSVTGDTRVRASFGTAFREPNFNESFSTEFTVGNPALVPERTRSWEVGATHQLGSVLEIGATWFDQRFTNLIQYYGAAAPGAPNYVNLASASARGLELTWQHTGAKTPIIFGGSWTFLHTEVLDAGTGASGTFVTGQALLRRPSQQGSLTLGYRLAGIGSLQITAQHVGDRSDRNFGTFPATAVTLPSFQRYDVAADLPLRSLLGPAAPAITVRVDNLTNAAFQSVYGYPSPGRAVLVGFRTGFDL